MEPCCREVTHIKKGLSTNVSPKGAASAPLSGSVMRHQRTVSHLSKILIKELNQGFWFIVEAKDKL
jgi:hypothetical protein